MVKILKPTPASVSDVLDHIGKKYNYNEITEFDLSHNNIHNRYENDDGIILIINFVIKNLHNIEKLDLSYNYIEHNEEI